MINSMRIKAGKWASLVKEIPDVNDYLIKPSNELFYLDVYGGFSDPLWTVADFFELGFSKVKIVKNRAYAVSGFFRQLEIVDECLCFHDAVGEGRSYEIEEDIPWSIRTPHGIPQRATDAQEPTP